MKYTMEIGCRSTLSERSSWLRKKKAVDWLVGWTIISDTGAIGQKIKNSLKNGTFAKTADRLNRSDASVSLIWLV